MVRCSQSGWTRDDGAEEISRSRKPPSLHFTAGPVVASGLVVVVVGGGVRIGNIVLHPYQYVECVRARVSVCACVRTCVRACV